MLLMDGVELRRSACRAIDEYVHTDNSMNKATKFTIVFSQPLLDITGRVSSLCGIEWHEIS